MNKYRKRNLFSKYCEIFLIKVNLALKENKEYKTNFLFFIIIYIMYLVIFMVFYGIFGGLVEEILSWNLYDFYLHLLTMLLMSSLISLFCIFGLNRILLSGELNHYLMRPVNSYFMLSINSMQGAHLILMPLIFVIFIFSIYLGNYQNYIFGILLFLFGVFYFWIFFNLLQSTAFFIKSNDFIIMTLNQNLNGAIEQYTPKLFEKSLLRHIAYLFPSGIYSFLVVEILNRREDILFDYKIILLISFSFMIILLIGFWRFGLRKYEAYN